MIQHNAAQKIQRNFRDLLRRIESRRRREAMKMALRVKMCIKCQAFVRGYIARKRFPAMALEMNGRRVLAARVIQKAWINFRNLIRLDKLLDEHRAKRMAKRIVTLRETQSDLQKDILDIKNDISTVQKVIDRCRVRIKELDDFQIEVNMRLPQLREELNAITLEDVDHGWGEAFGMEFESLTFQSAMARQEARLRKALLRKQLRELLDLQLELEIAELEMDDLSMRLLETVEALRRTNIAVIDKRLRRKLQREIRIEKCRWKIDTNRTNVIRRGRVGLQNLVKKVIMCFV